MHIRIKTQCWGVIQRTLGMHYLFNKELKNHDKIAYQNQNIWSKLLLQFILEKTLISRILNFKVKEKIIIVVQNGLATYILYLFTSQSIMIDDQFRSLKI